MSEEKQPESPKKNVSEWLWVVFAAAVVVWMLVSISAYGQTDFWKARAHYASKALEQASNLALMENQRLACDQFDSWQTKARFRNVRDSVHGGTNGTDPAVTVKCTPMNTCEFDADGGRTCYANASLFGDDGNLFIKCGPAGRVRDYPLSTCCLFYRADNLTPFYRWGCE